MPTRCARRRWHRRHAAVARNRRIHCLWSRCRSVRCQGAGALEDIPSQGEIVPIRDARVCCARGRRRREGERRRRRHYQRQRRPRREIAPERRGLTKLLILAKRERVKENFRHDRERLSIRIRCRLLTNRGRGLPSLCVADIVGEFGRHRGRILMTARAHTFPRRGRTGGSFRGIVSYTSPRGFADEGG